MAIDAALAEGPVSHPPSQIVVLFAVTGRTFEPGMGSLEPEGRVPDVIEGNRRLPTVGDMAAQAVHAAVVADELATMRILVAGGAFGPQPTEAQSASLDGCLGRFGGMALAAGQSGVRPDESEARGRVIEPDRGPAVLDMTGLAATTLLGGRRTGMWVGMAVGAGCGRHAETQHQITSGGGRGLNDVL